MNKIRGVFKLIFTNKYSWLTNGVTGAGFFAAGDLIEQTMEIRFNTIRRYNFNQTGRMALVGFFQGPGKQIFFWGLERFFPGRSASAVWKKVIVDQFISSPVFYFQFFMGMSIMEGKSVQEAWEELLRKFPVVFLVDLILWTPCQIINFRFVPVAHRVLFVNILTVNWNVFLSYVKHHDQHEDPRIKDCCRRGTCECHKNFMSLPHILGLLQSHPLHKNKSPEHEHEHVNKHK